MSPRSGASSRALDDEDRIGGLPPDVILLPKLRNRSTTPEDFLMDLGEPAFMLLGYALTFLAVKWSSPAVLFTGDIRDKFSLENFSVVFSIRSLVSSDDGASCDILEESGESDEYWVCEINPVGLVSGAFSSNGEGVREGTFLLFSLTTPNASRILRSFSMKLCTMSSTDCSGIVYELGVQRRCRGEP